DEHDTQYVEAYRNLAALAGQQLQRRVGQEAQGDAVGDGEGQRHHHHGNDRRDGIGVVLPVDVRHAAHHQHRDIDQRTGGGAGGNHAGQRGEEHGGQEQQTDGDGGEPGAATGGHARGTLYVAGDWRATDEGTDDTRGTVGLQRAGKVLDLAVFVHQVRPV